VTEATDAYLASEDSLGGWIEDCCELGENKFEAASTQPISQTLAKVDPSTISDEELAAIAMNGASVNAQAH
jgi:phage/plasmid-associated DNA primase